jgi:phosphonate transport system substrate-binding protein
VTKSNIIAVIVTIVFAAAALFYLVLSSIESRSEYEQIDLQDTISTEELSAIQKSEQTKDVIVFGFDLRHNIEEDIRQYVPFLRYLQDSTGYKFKLHFTSENSNIVDDIGTGIIHFAAIGANTYIKAKKKYDIIPLVRGLNKDNKAEYQSVLITRVNSPIQNIKDVEGKSFAFGSRTSTQGYLIPRIILAQHGITLDMLASYEWTGSHQKCANAVSSGRFDIGGIQDSLGQEFDKDGTIRVFYTSEYYPSSGISANKQVSPEIIDKVEKALLDFEPRGRHAQGLYNWDKTEMPNGFTKAVDRDYVELRKWMKKFDLLD